MRLDLACADYTFPLLSHDKALDVVALLGFTAINIGVFSGRSHVTPEDVLPDIPAAAKNLTMKLNDRGLAVADIFYQASDFEDRAANHPDMAQRRQSRDLYQRMVEFALRCNSPHITGLPGIHWSDEPLDSSLQRSAEELAWRVEQARQLGIVYSVEPHLGSVVATPQDVQHLVDLAPTLTLTLDYGHFVYQGFPENEIEPLLRYASHFHARCAAPRRLQAKFQDNSINFGRILNEMNRIGYSGT